MNGLKPGENQRNPGKDLTKIHWKPKKPLHLIDTQLRQDDENPSNREKELKKFLKSRGILFGDYLEGTKLYFADEWDKIVEECEKWRSAMENCYIILKNKNQSEPARQQQDQLYRSYAKDKKGIIAQCQTRFSLEKKKITRWRMENFSDKMKKGGFRFGLQITLTTDPKRFRNLKEVGDNWKIFMKHFMDFANARLRRAGRKNTTCYLRACELTESGLLHIHIGFYGPGITGKITKKYANGRTVKDYLFPQKDIRELWDKYGIGEVTWINKAPVDELCDYVTKHISKSWVANPTKCLKHFYIIRVCAPYMLFFLHLISKTGL